jgi:hypothetical protein
VSASNAAPASSRHHLERYQFRQLAWITAGAIAIFVTLRLLPTGTNLSHMDFRVDPRAGNAIDFCDPLNPQFIPVVAARSPVILKLAPDFPAAAGREVHATLTLQTASGKPVAPEDLLVTHTRKLHLLIVDPTLADYQHVHPEPGAQRGTWTFAFTPRLGGTYRVFADFTPAATARGLYASTDLPVDAAAGAALRAEGRSVKSLPQLTAERDGHRFTLTLGQPPRAGQPIDLRFAIVRDDGKPVAMQPVMGAFAHLVAFDDARSGFAHLHPTQADLLLPPDALHPALDFKLTIPRAGHYVIWAQVNLAGKETFVPFEFEVK